LVAEGRFDITTELEDAIPVARQASLYFVEFFLKAVWAIRLSSQPADQTENLIRANFQKIRVMRQMKLGDSGILLFIKNSSVTSFTDALPSFT